MLLLFWPPLGCAHTTYHPEYLMMCWFRDCVGSKMGFDWLPTRISTLLSFIIF